VTLSQPPSFWVSRIIWMAPKRNVQLFCTHSLRLFFFLKRWINKKKLFIKCCWNWLEEGGVGRKSKSSKSPKVSSSRSAGSAHSSSSGYSSQKHDDDEEEDQTAGGKILGVHFTFILQSAFRWVVDPKIAKMMVKASVILHFWNQRA